jgi:hypothetical protein
MSSLSLLNISIKTIELPIDNTIFKLATLLDVIDRGTVGWMNTRSKLAIGQVGPYKFVVVHFNCGM